MKKLIYIFLVVLFFGCEKSDVELYNASCVCSLSENGFTEYSQINEVELDKIKNQCEINGCTFVKQ